MANVYVFDYALAAPEIQALAAARPGNMTPTAHAGPGKTVLLADGVTLAGALSDDGLPDPPALTTATWSLVSGPGTVSFDNVHALNAHASFSAAGTYVLRLTASDSVLSASDDVQITVVANNLAPVVSAGPDKSIMLPASVTLVGTVSDEGLPNPPAATSCTWTCVSGPGPVTFANPNAAATTATFFTAGTYVVRLTATDSALSGWDDVTIIASGVYEFGPVVSIIAPSSITVPTRTVSLAGSVSDDGRPAPPPATCAWSVVSGPGPVSFSNPAAASTTASLRCAGTYVLRLTASDGLLTGHADATITLDGGGYLTSDFNGDGCVDGVDFLIWQSHYPAAAGATKATGDANGDGKVDGVDFLTWQVEYAIWQ
jgi:hypothetical protein